MSLRTRQFLQWSAGIVLLALLLRLPWMYNALEYDELWSLQHYTTLSFWQILTDLGLPNNHPLNSLCMKLTAGFDSRVMLRLHSLLAGLGTVIAGGWFALYYFRNRRAALWTMLCLAVSMPLIGYSQAARGYSLQTFFITLFALSAVAMQPRFRGKGALRYLPECGVVLSGLGAVWSVSSSALFLFPVSLAAVWQGWRRWRHGDREYAGLAAFAVFGLFILGWYGSLWQVMRGAQVWAEPVTGVGMYAAWVWKIFWELGCPFVLFVLLALFRKNRLIACVVLVPVLVSIWTNLAGSRVFLPLVPAFAVMVGYGAARFRRKGWMIPALFAVFSLWQKPVWTSVDWYRVFDDARIMPQECLVLYSATSGYPLSENNGKPALSDFVRRLQYAGPDRAFILVGSPVLNGVDAEGREQEIAPLTGTKIRLGGLEAWRVKPAAVSAMPARGDLLLAVIPPQKPETVLAVIRQLMACGPGWQLNGWLTRSVWQNGRPFLYRLVVFRVESPEKSDPGVWKLPPGVVQLYRMPEKR